jgi:hypothetical protein
LNERRIDLAWGLLLAATCATWLIGESGSGGAAAMALVALISFAKGRAVVLDFMALRGVRVLWRALLLGWLVLVLGLVALAYRLAMNS